METKELSATRKLTGKIEEITTNLIMGLFNSQSLPETVYIWRLFRDSILEDTRLDRMRDSAEFKEMQCFIVDFVDYLSDCTCVYDSLIDRNYNEAADHVVTSFKSLEHLKLIKSIEEIIFTNEEIEFDEIDKKYLSLATDVMILAIKFRDEMGWPLKETN